MIRIRIQDNDYNIKIDKFFENGDDASKFLDIFLRNAKNNAIDYKQTLDRIDGGKTMSSYSTIVFNNKTQVPINISGVEIEKDFKEYKAVGKKSIIDVFPENWEAIKKSFDEFISKIEETEDCIDAYRIGLIDDKESMDEYWTYVSCCGSTDQEVEINGVKYMFGCNYGH